MYQEDLLYHRQNLLALWLFLSELFICMCITTRKKGAQLEIKHMQW